MLAARRSFAFRLAAIVAAGVVIRAVHTLLFAPWPPGIFNDEAYYSTLAQLIADGEGFIRPGEFYGEDVSVATAERAPLFPALLAVLAKLGLTGSDPGLAELGVVGGDGRSLGVITGGGTILVLGLLGRKLAGERAGLFAAGLAAVYPTLIAADGALMTESLYGLLSALSLLAAYRLVEEPRPGRALVLGVVVGVAALARAEALLLLPLLLVPLVRRPGGPRAAAVVCITFAVVLAPWTARNWTAFDRPVLIATEAGETLAGANCDATYFGDTIGFWDFSCARFSAGENEAATLNEKGREGIRYALDHLDRVPVVAAARLGRTWGFYDPFRRPEGRAAWVTHLGLAMYVLLLPLAVYGLLALRRRGVGVWILTAPFITVTITTLLAYGSARFRHSAELSLVVLAAVALARLKTAPSRGAPRMIARDGPVHSSRRVAASRTPRGA